MESDIVAKADVSAGAEVMASVEDGREATFIIADVSKDGSYMTIPLAKAASLPAWR